MIFNIPSTQKILFGLVMATALTGVLHASESRFGVLEDQQHVITTVPRPPVTITPVTVVVLPVSQTKSEMLIEEVTELPALLAPNPTKRKRQFFKPGKPKVICTKDAA